ncbi:hypothetical protein FRC05_000990 [Tulasnella sp. 425]|nr:hypothetical protein FRC05_000990 [Tulasnella sp. 425]
MPQQWRAQRTSRSWELKPRELIFGVDQMNRNASHPLKSPETSSSAIGGVGGPGVVGSQLPRNKRPRHSTLHNFIGSPDVQAGVAERLGSANDMSSSDGHMTTNMLSTVRVGAAAPPPAYDNLTCKPSSRPFNAHVDSIKNLALSGAAQPVKQYGRMHPGAVGQRQVDVPPVHETLPFQRTASPLRPFPLPRRARSAHLRLRRVKQHLPNWEAALTILIRKYVIQRKDATPTEVDRYRHVVQTLIDTTYEPDLAIALFRDEGIEEDIWARGMSGTAGYGGLRHAVGSSGKRAKLPKYIGNLVPKILGSLGSEALDQVNSDRVWAALADFFDLQRFGIDTWEEVSEDEEVAAYLTKSLEIVERLFSSGSSQVRGEEPAASRSATQDLNNLVSGQVVHAEPSSVGSDTPLTICQPIVLTSDSEGEHSVRCDATTPPTTLASSSPPSTSRTTPKTRSKRATRPRCKPHTKPTPSEQLGLDLKPSPYPTPNLFSQWKPHSPSSTLATPTPSSTTTNLTPVGGTILQLGSTFAQRKAYAVRFRTHQNRGIRTFLLRSFLDAQRFVNPEERRRFDEGRTPLERQINSERRREVWGHVLRLVGPAAVRDEEVWSDVSGRLRGVVYSWDEK